MCVIFSTLLFREHIDAVLVNIRPYQFAILQSHNFYRRMEPASNMRYMVSGSFLSSFVAYVHLSVTISEILNLFLVSRACKFVIISPEAPPQTCMVDKPYTSMAICFVSHVGTQHGVSLTEI